MWLADGWKDYEVIDTSTGEKLERWGEYILVRPDPQVIHLMRRLSGSKKMLTITEAAREEDSGNLSIFPSSGRSLTGI